ncbi:MAG: TonB-dependent receptor plug domain-containing protein [Arachidicoccus sp.]|nr:TonB-dependent receptor plug domain-containing protein [Arachidicoccus sp.]
MKCRRMGIAIVLSNFCLSSLCAQTNKLFTDSVHILDTVKVTAFDLQVHREDAPAAVSVINKQQLQLLDNTTLVPIFNTIPGVRMEERSPGSYRLSLRGSLLRSPYGVRNVKMYWNDIPFTDAGGNTYLQLVDASQLQSAEIIKGPASSLYGANTGGAVILHSGRVSTAHTNDFNLGMGTGSYNLFDEHAAWTYTDKNFQSNLQQSHLQNNGCRQQSALRKNIIKWDGSTNISTHEKLNYIFFYSDIFYQTPGGLTLHQLETDTSAYPLAVTQHAAVYNKTFFSGISLESALGKDLDNTTSLMFNHTSFKNPFTNNYEIRHEWNYGGRTNFDYHIKRSSIRFDVSAGVEWLQNHSYITDNGNKGGQIDTLQFKDELYATQYFGFVQTTLQINDTWILQAGLSENQQKVRYRRPSDMLQQSFVNGNTKKMPAPCVSVLYKITKNIHVYALAAKGFSPPALAELHPSNGTFNDSLQPEFGWNFETGFKGNAIGNRLQFDASIYNFSLHDAIVSRGATNDAAYYVNAGSTQQRGFELWLSGIIIHNERSFLSDLQLSNSFSYQPFKFKNYTEGSSVYSGNRLTGVPKFINATTVSANTRKGFFLNILLNNTSSLPLDDANDAFAKPYHLLQSKIGFHFMANKITYEIFMMLDNCLNETYSLGNDLNAYGGRFYNPAPKRNYSVGGNISL